MKQNKIAAILIIIVIMTLSISCAKRNRHSCRDTIYTYSLSDDKYYINQHKDKCCGKDSNTNVHTFSDVKFDFTLSKPDGVTSVDDIAFETGTTILKDQHYKISNVKTDTSYTGGGTTWTDGVDDSNKTFSLDNVNYSNSSNFSLSLGEGKHTMYAQVTDTYPGKTVTESESFCIGPYPTVSCNVELIDNNQKDSHIDSIKVSNIKLKSTYKPQKLIFELYKGDTYTGKSYTTTVNNATAYSTGYNSIFNNIEATNIGLNLKPGEAINISVRVVDGRGTGITSVTDPNAPKYAKYSNIDVF